jgi:hypothetical protein
LQQDPITDLQQNPITNSQQDSITDAEPHAITDSQQDSITDAEPHAITDSQQDSITNTESIGAIQSIDACHSQRSGNRLSALRKFVRSLTIRIKRGE